MKNKYIISFLLLLSGWSIGFFIFNAGPPIHTLIGLSILILLHAVLKCDFSIQNAPDRNDGIRYQQYSRIFKKERKEVVMQDTRPSEN